MRFGDVRGVWVLLVLFAACERRAQRRAQHVPLDGVAATSLVPSPAAATPVSPSPAASTPVSPGASGSPPVAPGPATAPTVGDCPAGWWPLAAGQRWRWRIERHFVDATGVERHRTDTRVAEVHAPAAPTAARRFAITGWPAPWTDALTTDLLVEVDATTIRAIEAATPRPWLELARDAHPDTVDRQLTPGTRPAELVFTWRSMADNLTVRLACGVGPISLDYHHHGTREELHALRIP